MNWFEPDFHAATSGSETLAVVLHGYYWPRRWEEAFAFVRNGFSGPNRERMDELISIVRKEFSTGGVDVYAPTLPYSHPLDSTGANQIVLRLTQALDDIWNTKPGGYKKVVLIGHSMGGIILRRVFLAGSPRPPDYSGEFKSRDDLPKSVSRDPDAHEWAKFADRLVLIATWDKGWSISERDGWFYSVPLNIFGLLGHLSPLAGTLFDVRRGAPFIVQTRLLWLAYRRWHNLAHGADVPTRQEGTKPQGADPLVIQIIGTKDDFVSPVDQVDSQVNGVLGNDPKPRYFLLEMKETDHLGTVTFNGPQGDRCKKIFRAALGQSSFIVAASAPATGDPDTDDAVSASDPWLFDDDFTTPDLSVRNLVFVIHGIRDDGFWTHRIAKAIKEAWQRLDNQAITSVHSVTSSYGYFALLPFILPWIRRQKVEWFMDQYVSAKARYPNAKFHYVGHSNGTYLAARALQDYSAARFGNIYFAGSVVRTTYDWPAFTAGTAQRVQRFHNARGATDWVVALAPKSIDYVSDLGGGGFDGFGPPTPVADTPEITQSTGYAWGGHGGAISEGHWPGIAQFIVTGEKPPEPSNLFTSKPHPALDYLSRLRLIGVPLIVVAVPSLVVWAIQRLFECSRWYAFTVPEYSLLTLALLSSVLFFLYPKQSPVGRVARVLKIATMLGGSFLGVWFLVSLISLAFFQCSSVSSAILLVALLTLLRFFLTRF